MPGPDIQVINSRILPADKALAKAQEIVAKVRSMLDIGAANQPTSGPAQVECVNRLRKFTAPDIQFRGAFFWSVGDLRTIADRAIRSRCGNCGEQSAIAFMMCVESKIEPIDYMQCAGPNEDHAFLVIGRREDSDPSRYDARWGKDAVVCDPWMNAAYPCSQMSVQLISRSRSFLFESKCRYRTVNGLTPT
jgi:hypothetical protein